MQQNIFSFLMIQSVAVHCFTKKPLYLSTPCFLLVCELFWFKNMSLQHIDVCTQMLFPHFKSDVIVIPIFFLREGKWFINIFHFTTHCINHWTDLHFSGLSAQPPYSLRSGKGLLSLRSLFGFIRWKALRRVNSEISFQLSFAVLKEVNSQHCRVAAVKTNRKQLSCNFEAGVLLEEVNQHYPLRYSLSLSALTHSPAGVASC